MNDLRHSHDVASEALTPSEIPAAGEIVAEKYRVGDLVGAGAMGVVLRATHVQLEQPVALKLLRRARAGSATAVARFLREARAVSRIRSEHVVRVYDVGMLASGVPFLVMDLLEGTDLEALLASNGPLEAAAAARYLLEACAGVEAAHRSGVVHRDLKPSNLFVARGADGQECLKVLDFGVSKVLAQDRGRPASQTTQADSVRSPPTASSRRPGELAAAGAGAEGPSSRAGGPGRPGRDASLTHPRALLGSPRYMSPEQIVSPTSVDGRTDVWALGAILYELIAGRAAFEGESVEEVLAAVASARRLPLSELRPGCPPWVHAIVDRCLARSPDLRFPGPAALADALREGLAASPPREGAATSTERSMTTDVRGAAPGSTLRPLPAVVLAVAAAATVTLALTARRPQAVGAPRPAVVAGPSDAPLAAGSTPSRREPSPPAPPDGWRGGDAPVAVAALLPAAAPPEPPRPWRAAASRVAAASAAVAPARPSATPLDARRSVAASPPRPVPPSAPPLPPSTAPSAPLPSSAHDALHLDPGDLFDGRH